MIIIMLRLQFEFRLNKIIDNNLNFNHKIKIMYYYTVTFNIIKY